MRIVELKSQSVKVIYKPAVEQIKIGDFISFTDGDITIIAQVYKILTSDAADDFNQADLLFVLTKQFDIIKQWQGEFFSANAIISMTSKDDIAKYIHNSKTKEIFSLSQSAQFKETLPFDFEKFTTPAFIGYEKREDNFNFIKTIAKICNKLNKTLVVVDVKGNMNFDNATKIIAGNNIKLPLNSTILENLCEIVLQGVSLESKAVIEDILLELSEYVKTSETGFIPVTQLISVINDYYKKSKISPLILLVNKLKHYKNMNLFADNKEDISFLEDLQEEHKTVIFDLSHVSEEWQKIFFTNMLEQNNKNPQDFYISINSDDNIYDKKTFNYLLFKAINNGIKPIISINYRNSSFDNIFDFCNNAFLFKTNNALKKRSVLTDIIQSLPQNVFITKGKLSNGLLLPLIINEQEEEILDYIEHEISETNTLEEIKEDITPQTFENLDNALTEPQNPIFKNPTEFINTPVNHIPVINNAEISEPIIQIQQQEIQEELVEEQITEQEETEKILNFENVNIPAVREELVPSEPEPITELSVEEDIPVIQEVKPEPVQEPEIVPEPITEVPVEEDIPVIQEVEIESEPVSEPEPIPTSEPEPIIENNILQDENVDIADVADDTFISNDDDILDLVENDETNNNLDIENISGETEMENVDIDELDFLNETIPDVAEQNNIEDDDLLDLIDTKEPIQLENSLDDIDFEQTMQETADNEFEEIAVEDDLNTDFDENTNNNPNEISQQNSSKIPVYAADNYATNANHKELNFKEGDIVKHSKYGVGTIKKITSHADKVLCHINFDSCGRRLLDPEISEIEKIG